jgi:SAM-dependent methyltransferase
MHDQDPDPRGPASFPPPARPAATDSSDVPDAHSSGRMHPLYWLPADASSVLDVGCNVGDLLVDAKARSPRLVVAGVDVNEAALAVARRRLPDAELYVSGAEALPFADERFDVVTCIEVLEHIPADRRVAALAEMRRVLRPAGRLLLRVPHAGLTAWMDSNNLRFRFPALYGALLGRGRRDAGYAGGSHDVVWHEHFSVPGLLELAGAGWSLDRVQFGGLVLYPLADIVSWPFYRLGRTDSVVYRAVQQMAAFDLAIDYGRASFDVLLVMRREGPFQGTIPAKSV